MAFLVTVPVQTAIGVDVSNTHWRWRGIYIDLDNSAVHCVIKGWSSRDAFVAGAQPIGEKTFILTGQDFLEVAYMLETPAAFPGLSVLVNGRARQLEPLFTNAQDVE